MELPYEIKNGYRLFDWRHTCAYITQQGKIQYGQKFQLNREDWPIIRKLIIYHVRDEELAQKEGLDLSKGLLLIGPIGCGKTSMMHLFQLLAYRMMRYRVLPSRTIAFEFQEEGYNVIHRYGRKLYPICFDDLGLEQNIKHYGNECNTMAEILLHRYELFTTEGIITHATSNLNSTELENIYGNRVRSRLREMFNLVSFPETSHDKRKWTNEEYKDKNEGICLV